MSLKLLILLIFAFFTTAYAATLAENCASAPFSVAEISAQIEKIREFFKAQRGLSRKYAYQVGIKNADWGALAVTLPSDLTTMMALQTEAGITIDLSSIASSAGAFLATLVANIASTPKDKAQAAANYLIGEGKKYPELYYQAAIENLADKIGLTKDQLLNYIDNTSQKAPLPTVCVIYGIRNIKTVKDLVIGSLDAVGVNVATLIRNWA